MPEPRVLIITGDLVEQDVDAIVNAANNRLGLGAGVAGAIRMCGGPEIQRECDEQAPITGGGRLPARHVIHAASMALGGCTTRSSLKSAMDNSFRLARDHGVQTIAIPAVGTGIAGFPIDECARVMADCLRYAIRAGWNPLEVRFVLYNDDTRVVFEGPFASVFRTS